MIIESLFDIFSNMALWVLNLIDLPDMPPMIIDLMGEVKEYLVQGANILALFTNWPLVMLLATTCLFIIVARETYLLLMWVLNKIPFIDID